MSSFLSDFEIKDQKEVDSETRDIVGSLFPGEDEPSDKQEVQETKEVEADADELEDTEQFESESDEEPQELSDDVEEDSEPEENYQAMYEELKEYTRNLQSKKDREVAEERKKREDLERRFEEFEKKF